MITMKRYFDRGVTRTLIRLLLLGLALGHFSHILPDTQNHIKNMSPQSGALAGKVTVGDATYAALSKDRGITTIYRTSYPNQTVMLTSQYRVSWKSY